MKPQTAPERELKKFPKAPRQDYDAPQPQGAPMGDGLEKQGK